MRNGRSLVFKRQAAQLCIESAVSKKQIYILRLYCWGLYIFDHRNICRYRYWIIVLYGFVSCGRHFVSVGMTCCPWLFTPFSWRLYIYCCHLHLFWVFLGVYPINVGPYDIDLHCYVSVRRAPFSGNISLRSWGYSNSWEATTQRAKHIKKKKRRKGKCNQNRIHGNQTKTETRNAIRNFYFSSEV